MIVGFVNQTRYLSPCLEVLYLDSGVEFAKQFCTVGAIGKWDVKELETNVLPLQNVTLFVKGEKIIEDSHVSFA